MTAAELGESDVSAEDIAAVPVLYVDDWDAGDNTAKVEGHGCARAG